MTSDYKILFYFVLPFCPDFRAWGREYLERWSRSPETRWRKDASCRTPTPGAAVCRKRNKSVFCFRFCLWRRYLELFSSTSQTAHLLPCLPHRWRGYNFFLPPMPQPGIKLTSVQLHFFWGTLIQDALLALLQRPIILRTFESKTGHKAADLQRDPP